MLFTNTITIIFDHKLYEKTIELITFLRFNKLILHRNMLQKRKKHKLVDNDFFENIKVLSIGKFGHARKL